MMKLIFSLCVISFSAQAQTISLEQDAYNLAREIQFQAPQLTLDQKMKISDQLKAIRSTMYNIPTTFSDYACVSKDNDGRAPYILAMKSGVEIKRIAGSIFQTMDTCLDSLKSIRSVPTGAIACVAKDADGKNPWQLALLDQVGGMKKITPSVITTLMECQTVLKKMAYSGMTNQASFCASRDNDARAPYVAASIDVTSGLTKTGNETFLTIDACWTFIETPTVR